MEETWDTSFRDLTRFWVQFVLVPIVVIVGILGNILTIFILTRNQTRLPSNVYLIALAMSDLLFLICSFSMSWKHYELMKSLEFYWRYIPFGLWITDASSSTSVWLTVCFTIERCVAICHPTSLNCSATVKRARVLAALVYLTCFLLTASTSMEWKVSTVISANINSSNETTFFLENTELGHNQWYRLIYHWFSTLVFVLVPVFLLGIGNLFLISAIRASRKVRQELISCYIHRRQGQQMRQEDRITLTLIVIIILFFICQLPTATVLIYTSMYNPEEGSVEENVLLALGNIFNLLVAVNASCNFILYTAISDKYREEFIHVFCLEWLLRYCRNRKRRETVYVLPEIFTPEEKLRYLQQQGLEVGCNSVCLESSEVDAVKNMKGKSFAVLRRCTTCQDNENRSACSFHGNYVPERMSV